MNFMKAIVAVFVFLCASGVVFPGEHDYIVVSSLDLLKILPEPPREGSAQYEAELDEILSFQKSRTEKMITYARADQDKNVFRFSTIFGESFNGKNLPLTDAFFSRTISNGSRLADPVKDFWKRTRPYTADTRVKPCVKIPSGFSYPSSHALAGRLVAIILSRMVPERSGEILRRGDEFAENRVIGGVHFRSDIEAGKRAADAIAESLFNNENFIKDYNSSRKEIRKFLGYERGEKVIGGGRDVSSKKTAA